MKKSIVKIQFKSNLDLWMLTSEPSIHWLYIWLTNASNISLAWPEIYSEDQNGNQSSLRWWGITGKILHGTPINLPGCAAEDSHHFVVAMLQAMLQPCCKTAFWNTETGNYIDWLPQSMRSQLFIPPICLHSSLSSMRGTEIFNTRGKWIESIHQMLLFL